MGFGLLKSCYFFPNKLFCNLEEKCDVKSTKKKKKIAVIVFFLSVYNILNNAVRSTKICFFFSAKPKKVLSGFPVKSENNEGVLTGHLGKKRVGQ